LNENTKSRLQRNYGQPANRTDANVSETGNGSMPGDAMPAGSPTVNALSVDVEEYFQVWALSKVTERNGWEAYPSRVCSSVEKILDLMDVAGAKATFFTLGWIAERHPNLVRRIADSGHEVASHGYAHAKITSQGPDEFRADVIRAKTILEDVTGRPVLGYRAPSFSIGDKTLWALDILQETGHLYSSSIYPISHDHYGMPGASRFAHRHGSRDILEVPLSTARLAGRNLPCGGGGYFRIAPYAYFRWAIQRLNARERQPAVFYFHPWELDPDQPRVRGVPLKSRFRHYANLDRMEARVQRLLADFEWRRMDQLFLTR
jgi:polysaccharide deacetylase family protein (PEP-CTERM system associated)